MKEIYIAEPDGRRLADVQRVLQRIDPANDKYRRIVNPFEGKRVRTATLSEILDLTDSGSLDLMVLPLDLDGSAKFDRNNPEGSIKEFSGVKMGLDYKMQGYRKPVILTMDGYYSGTFEMYVVKAGKEGDEPDNKDGLALALQVFCGKDYLNLYSTALPEDTKVKKFLNTLEGVPHVDVSVMDIGTGNSTTIAAEKDILPDD